jgi:hypothetical protein
LNIPPQPSSIVPQLSFAGHDVTGVHPHRFGVPPPPHDLPAGHMPQSIVLPHPSDTIPQSAFCDAQLAGTHASTPPPPHTFGTPPPPHVSGAVHVPQFNVLPHPSTMLPHVAPCAAHVVGAQPQ